MGCCFGGGSVSRQGQHPHFAAFPGRATRERKREASEIPEWIERCYVTGAASSAPQEARSRGERQSSGWGHPSSFSSISQVSGHLGGSCPVRHLGWGGKGSPTFSQGTVTFLLCPPANGGGCNNHRKERQIRSRGCPKTEEACV